MEEGIGGRHGANNGGKGGRAAARERGAGEGSAEAGARDVEQGGGGVREAGEAGAAGENRRRRGEGVRSRGAGEGEMHAPTGGRRVLTQAAELKYLCEMFSNIDQDEVKKTWADAKR
jgi:hypothetical protein